MRHRQGVGMPPDPEAKKNHGIRAHNQEYRRYERVEKTQKYRLAEDLKAEAYDDEYQIQTCDLNQYLQGNSEDRRQFSQALGKALEDIGFAILVGQGINPEIYERTRDEARRFFEETTLEQRMSYRARRHGSVNQGFFQLEQTSDIHPDLVEGWVFCRRAFDLDERADYCAADFWPISREPRFRPYILAHEPLFVPIMQSILTYLGCDPHLYDRRLTRTNFGFRLNYYPPVGERERRSGAGRILGHEDVDLFTLLAAPDVEGLQVLNRRNMKWIRLEAPPGSLILNTGDYMQRITNDRLPSTTHRVTLPRDPKQWAKPRITFPLAVYLWEKEMLEVLPGLPRPKYPPIKAIHFHTQITSKYYGDDYAVQD